MARRLDTLYNLTTVGDALTKEGHSTMLLSALAAAMLYIVPLNEDTFIRALQFRDAVCFMPAAYTQG